MYNTQQKFAYDPDNEKRVIPRPQRGRGNLPAQRQSFCRSTANGFMFYQEIATSPKGSSQ